MFELRGRITKKAGQIESRRDIKIKSNEPETEGESCSFIEVK